MSQTQTKKYCLSCGAVLHGRVDKKFCNDYCRNNYNNLQKAKTGGSELVKSVNKALLGNRKILEGLLKTEEEKVSVPKDRLLRLGFQFKYLTHLYTTKAGKTYYYCYDYGYLPLDNDWYLVVRKSDGFKE